MSEKKRCNCGKHKCEPHKEMTKTESLEHAKECLASTIERLECIKDTLDKISIEEWLEIVRGILTYFVGISEFNYRVKQGKIPAKGYDHIEFQIKIEFTSRKKDGWFNGYQKDHFEECSHD